MQHLLVQYAKLLGTSHLTSTIKLSHFLSRYLELQTTTNILYLAILVYKNFAMSQLKFIIVHHNTFEHLEYIYSICLSIITQRFDSIGRISGGPLS